MKWKKSPDWLVEMFEQVAPPEGACEHRKMFGYPSCFLGGNLFMGLWQDRMVVRLSAADRDMLGKVGGEPFEPMKGRPMREYMLMPNDMMDQPELIRIWVDQALIFARGLPKKVVKKAARRASGTNQPARRASGTNQPARRASGANQPARKTSARAKKPARKTSAQSRKAAKKR